MFSEYLLGIEEHTHTNERLTALSWRLRKFECWIDPLPKHHKVTSAVQRATEYHWALVENLPAVKPAMLPSSGIISSVISEHRHKIHLISG